MCSSFDAAGVIADKAGNIDDVVRMYKVNLDILWPILEPHIAFRKQQKRFDQFIYFRKLYEASQRFSEKHE